MTENVELVPNVTVERDKNDLIKARLEKTRQFKREQAKKKFEQRSIDRKECEKAVIKYLTSFKTEEILTFAEGKTTANHIPNEIHYPLDTKPKQLVDAINLPCVLGIGYTTIPSTYAYLDSSINLGNINREITDYWKKEGFKTVTLDMYKGLIFKI